MHPTMNARALILAAVLAMSTSACTLNGLTLTAPGLGANGGNGANGSPAPTGSMKPGQQTPTQTNGTRPGGTGTQQPPTGQRSPAPGASTAPVVNASPTISADVPAVYKKIYGASAIAVENGFVVITVNGLPDHETPYYTGTEWAATYGTDYTGTDRFVKNPSTISEQSYTFRIPVSPTEDAGHTASSLGSIGVSLNGVPFFNQYNKDNQPLDEEKVSWDQYLGHPAGGGDYHYHTVPTYLTEKFGEDALMGFLLDGFPVYGPKEGDKTLTSADLDLYHGHVGETPEFPQGIYHYHVTTDAPYILGEGYYGKPGTVSKGAVSGGTTGGTQSPPPGGQTGGMQSPPPGGQTQSPPPGGQQGGTQSPPPGGQTQSPPPGGQTGGQPQVGSITFSIAGSYPANQYPVKVELVTPDQTRTAATVTFTSAGQKVTINCPKAGHYMFVTTNGGTRTNKGWVNISSTATEVSLPLPQGSTAQAPSGPPPQN